MKFLLILLICASSAMAQTQNTELVDYMLQLQSLTKSYYDSMMFTFRDARRSLSRQLVDVNSVGVTEISEGLRTVITIRDEAQTSIEGASGSEQCLQNAIAAWETGIETAGVHIASCAEQSFTPILNATNDFSHYIKNQSTIAFEVQNMIVNVFAEVNPITEEDRITPFVSQQIDEIYTNFNNEVVPQLSRLLRAFETLQETLPIELQDCVNAATERLQDESLVLRNTLELC